MSDDIRSPLPSETYLRVTILDDGGALIEDVTYGFVAQGHLSYWDVKYYNGEKARYEKIEGKQHTYFVCGCDRDIATKIAIFYHKNRGTLPKWNFED